MVTLKPMYKPELSTTIKYRVRGVYHLIRIWTVSGNWNWEAGGRSETAPSRFMAEQQARRWLKDGQ